MGGSCEAKFFDDSCPPCTNDPAMTELVRLAAIATVGEAEVDDSEEVMTTGSDDMAFFLNATPGCYFIVGASNRDAKQVYPHHHPRFNIEEDALPVGVEVLTRAAVDFVNH